MPALTYRRPTRAPSSRLPIRWKRACNDLEDRCADDPRLDLHGGHDADAARDRRMSGWMAAAPHGHEPARIRMVRAVHRVFDAEPDPRDCDVGFGAVARMSFGWSGRRGFGSPLPSGGFCANI